MNSLYAVLKVQYIFNMAQWLSWLERRPVTAEVVGSNPTIHPFLWVTSSVGRALDF